MKAIYTSLSALLLIIVLSSNSYAQANYKPGYLVSSSGDTTKGFIDYKEWSINPDKINFKKSHNAQSIKYYPKDIKSFGVQHDIFISAATLREVSPQQTNSLEKNPEFQTVKDTIFLRLMVGGTKTLLTYRDYNGKDLFYIKKDGKYELLYYKEYLKKKDGDYFRDKKEVYLGQLQFYLRDCSSISSYLKGISYTKKALRKLFEEYYECVGTKSNYKTQKEKYHAKFGLTVGYAITNFSFSSGSSTFDYLTQADFSTSKDPTYGISFEVIKPRNRNKWSFYSDLLYTHFSTNGAYTQVNNPQDYTDNYSEVSFSHVKLSLLIRYGIAINRKMSLFLNGGLINSFLISTDKNLRKTDHTYYATSSQNTDVAIKNIKKYDFGGSIGVGLRYGSISIEGRFERVNGLSSSPNIACIRKRTYILLGYQF